MPPSALGGLQSEEPAGEEPVGCDHLALTMPLREVLEKCDCFPSLPNTVQGDRQATSLQGCHIFFFFHLVEIQRTGLKSKIKRQTP